jgi:hypothetical protein
VTLGRGERRQGKACGINPVNFRVSLVVWLGVAAVLLAQAPAAAQTARFSAQFASGKRLNGAEIFDWQDEKADPRLDNQKLFFSGDRVLWIEDNSIAPSELPDAYVEFFGGDRLPGRVLEYRTGQESPFRKSPPCLIVMPEGAVDWPETKRLAGLPVVTRWLRRVVWQARDDDRYRPGTLFYLNGRQIEFRALRWSKTSVRLLLEQETREVGFDQIAELHLPRPAPAPWEAWFDQLATLLPDGSGLVVQVETGDGVRATASSGRFNAAAHGDAGKPENWHHAVQPAWSLEPLWLPHRAIRMRRFFSPHEVPLSAIEPTRSVQKANLAGGWNFELDRNVHAWPMRCAEHAFGWGYGVHAYSELGFELPASARTFRTQYGLDRAAGSGGCVRAAIFAGPATGQALHRSDHVIGSAKSHDTGPLSIAGATQLTLVVDPAQNDRPPGADPFEIRDSFDWLQPVVELDPEALRMELERRSESSLWAWPGWTIVNARTKPCMISIAWDQQRPPARRCRVEVAPREAFFSIARKLEIGEQHRFLVMSVNRLDKETGPSRIQVRFNGRAAAEFEVPIRSAPADPDPLLVPVDRYRGKTVDVEIVQMALAPQARVEWRGIDLADHDPIVFEAFEDDPEFVSALADGGGTARLDQKEKFTGTVGLLVTPDDRNNPNLPGWNFPVRGDPNPGEYRYVRFAWKKHGGKEIGLHLAQNGGFAAPLLINPKETFRYHVGRGVKHDYGVSIQFRDKPPDQWELVTRDLFADFGAFDATGLRLVCGDGEWAAFDHIYFARRPQDLDRVTQNKQQPAADPMATLPPDLKATVVRIATNRARYGDALSEVAPAFSIAASEQGVWLYKTWQGRTKVVRTHPPEQGKPCILRAPVTIPADKHTELKLVVSHHPQSDWQLLIFANGEKLHDSLVASTTTQEGWAEVTVDLSRFAGHNIILELHNHPNNWSNEFAYWSRVELVSQ